MKGGTLVLVVLAFQLSLDVSAQSNPSNCPPETSPGDLANGVISNGNTVANPVSCYYSVDIPSGQLALKVEETNPTSVLRHVEISPPTGGFATCSIGTGLVACDRENPAEGRWTLRVSNYGHEASSSTDPFTIKATYSSGVNCGTPDSPIILVGGVEKSAAPAGSVGCYYAIDVPSGQLALKIVEANPSSMRRILDVSPPAGGFATCAIGTGLLTCNRPNPASGRWVIRVANYGNENPTSTDGFTIQATFGAGLNCGTLQGPKILTAGVGQSGAPAGSAACHFAIDVPDNQTSLMIEEANPTSAKRRVDVSPPTGGFSYCGNGAGVITCKRENPLPGRWIIKLANDAFSEDPESTDAFTVKVSYGATAEAGGLPEQALFADAVPTHDVALASGEPRSVASDEGEPGGGGGGVISKTTPDYALYWQIAGVLVAVVALVITIIRKS